MTSSTRVSGGTSSRGVLHHCCGYALRRFEKTLPEEADEIRPWFTGIAKTLRKLDDLDKPPGARWPKWRGKRDLYKQELGSWPALDRNGQPDDSSAGGEGRLQKDVLMDYTKLEAVRARRPLTMHLSDESTAMPASSEYTRSEGGTGKRPGRRAGARAHRDQCHELTRHAANESHENISIPLEALCSVLEEDNDQEFMWKQGSVGTPSIDDSPDGQEDIHAAQEREPEEEGRSEASQQDQPAAKSSLINSTEQHTNEQILVALSTSTRRIPQIGDQVWETISPDAILKQLQRNERRGGRARTAPLDEAEFLATTVEAMVGRLQEPCRTPEIGDSARAQEVWWACNLLECSIHRVEEDGTFGSIINALRNMLVTMEPLADKAKHRSDALRELQTLATSLQRIHRSLIRAIEWKGTHPDTCDEAPGILEILLPSGYMYIYIYICV